MRHSLFIRPRERASSRPVIDLVTRKMAAALLHVETKCGLMHGDHFVHTLSQQGQVACTCGMVCNDAVYMLPNGFLTSCLALHWLARHRDEVPPETLSTIRAFRYGEKDYAEGIVAGSRVLVA